MRKAIALLGPESTPHGIIDDLPCAISRQVEICAVVDPAQGPDCTQSMGLPVFASLQYAMARTGIHCLVYGDALLIVEPRWARA